MSAPAFRRPEGLPDFDPAEVSAWLAAEKAKLDFTGIDGPLCFHIGLDGVNMSGYEPKGTTCHWGRGVTFDAALADLRAKIPTGAILAKQNREQAARLLAEAEAIEAAAKKL